MVVTKTLYLAMTRAYDAYFDQTENAANSIKATANLNSSRTFNECIEISRQDLAVMRDWIGRAVKELGLGKDDIIPLRVAVES